MRKNIRKKYTIEFKEDAIRLVTKQGYAITEAARSVDIALVVRNGLFGWYIVEYEQNGADRCTYSVKV